MAPNKTTCGLQGVIAASMLLFFPVGIHAQNPLPDRVKIVHGIIVDGTTSQGIANVHIRLHSLVVVSDSDGSFLLALAYGDTIQFSHVSYLPYQTTFNQDLNHNQFVIVLSPRVTFLKEVSVTSLPTEIEFRHRVLETVPQLSLEEEIAKENIDILNRAAKFAMPLEMDSYQSYRDYIKGPQGVVIVSSNGSKGLVRAIKNVVLSKPYKFPSFVERRGGQPNTSVGK